MGQLRRNYLFKIQLFNCLQKVPMKSKYENNSGVERGRWREEVNIREEVLNCKQPVKR